MLVSSIILVVSLDSLLPGSSYLIYWRLGAWFQIYGELENEGCIYHITHLIGIHDVLQLHLPCRSHVMEAFIYWDQIFPMNMFSSNKTREVHLLDGFLVWISWFQIVTICGKPLKTRKQHPQTGVSTRVSMVLSNWVTTPILVGYLRALSRRTKPTYDHDCYDYFHGHPSSVDGSNIWRSPVEVGRLSHYITDFFTIQRPIFRGYVTFRTNIGHFGRSWTPPQTCRDKKKIQKSAFQEPIPRNLRRCFWRFPKEHHIRMTDPWDDCIFTYMRTIKINQN